MDPGYHSALIDFFRRGEVARDVRLLAAEGGLAPRAQEQLALLVLLADDSDSEIARVANQTIAALPLGALLAFLSGPEATAEMRQFFAARGIAPDGIVQQASTGEPLLDTLSELPDLPEQPETAEPDHKMLSSLPVLERIKLAMKGTREQRAALVRDSNKLVAAAVLSSPKLSEAEVAAFTRMGNVSEDTLRIIGMNRGWLKNYGVVLGLCRHPKAPPALSMQLVHRLNEKDQKMLANDRNIPEAVRVLARKIMSKGKLG
jgi:hypothetical protein